MTVPISFSDISLWLAVASIVILITSEVIVSFPEFSGRTLFDKSRLRGFGVGCGVAFLVTVVLR